MPGKPDRALASMGIYVFKTKFLIEVLREDTDDPNSSHDFGKDIIPAIVKDGNAIAHQFAAVACDGARKTKPTGATSAPSTPIWEANVDLTDFVPKLDLYEHDWPIWTYAEITPPAKFMHDEDGRRGSATSRWSPAAASSPARGSPIAAVHRRADPFVCR